MSIDAINRGLRGITEGIKGPSTEDIPPGRSEGATSFGEMLQNAVKQVNTLDQDAEMKVADTVAGKGAGNPHELIVSLEKADVAFELMNKVRQQLVRTYEEIMRTQV